MCVCECDLQEKHKVVSEEWLVSSAPWSDRPNCDLSFSNENSGKLEDVYFHLPSFLSLKVLLKLSYEHEW